MGQPRIRQAVRDMAPYVPGEQPTDPSVIKLNTNESPYAVSERVMTAVRAITADALRRYPDPTAAGLRRRLAERHACATDQIIVGNGSDEILALCTRAFVEDNGVIARFDPTYSLYTTLAAIRGARELVLPLDDAFAWPIDEALARLRGERACGLVFFTNPNAPTGRLCPPDEVARFAAGVDAVVLVDEAYVEFAPCDAMHLARETDNVLVLRTLSKSHALAGARLGYAVGPAPLIAALTTVKDSYNVNALTQAVAAAVLDDGPTVADAVARIVATRERLADGLCERGFTVIPSRANFVFARPPHIAARELAAALKADGILIRHFPGPRTEAYVRVSVGTDTQIDRLLDAVDRAIARRLARRAASTEAV